MTSLTDIPPPGRSFVRRLAPLGLLAAAMLVVGCYTVIRHPSGLDEGKPIAERFDQDEDCTRCHSDYAAYPYYDPGGVYPEYYFTNPNWGYYYGSPWWWHDPYIEIAESDGHEAKGKARRRRNVDERVESPPRGYQGRGGGGLPATGSMGAPPAPAHSGKTPTGGGTGAGSKGESTGSEKKDRRVVTGQSGGGSGTPTTVTAPPKSTVKTSEQPRTTSGNTSQDDSQGDSSAKASRNRGGGG